jgi:hypothetical protein
VKTAGGVLARPSAATTLWAETGTSMMPSKQRDNKISLAGDLCIDSLTIGTWNAAEKYLRRGRARERAPLETGNDKKLGVANQSSRQRGTYLSAYATTGEPKNGVDRSYSRFHELTARPSSAPRLLEHRARPSRDVLRPVLSGAVNLLKESTAANVEPQPGCRLGPPADRAR